MADNNQIIAASLKVDTEQAARNVLKLKGSVEDLKKEFKKAQAGSDEQITALKKLNAAEKDLSKATNDLSDANYKSTGHFAKIKDQVSALPGPLGQAGQGVSGLGSAFKALLANPIALVIVGIVGALKLLYSAFTSTNDGADKMEQIFSGISAVVEVVMNRIATFAGSVIKFLSGDFKGAAEQGRAAFKGLGDDIVSEFDKAYEGTKKMQEVEDRTRELGKSRAILNKDLAATKEIISDETATLKEKEKAIKKVGEAETKQTDAELDNAKKKLEALKLIKGSRDLSDEDLDEIAEAENEVTAIQEKSETTRRSINKQTRVIERESAAKAREERAKDIEKEKADRQQLVEFTNKLAQLQQENDLATIKDTYEKEKKIIQNKLDDQKRAAALSLQDKKITSEQYAKLTEALDIQANLQLGALDDKHNKEKADKEEAFQEYLNDIINKTKLSGMTDARAAEKLRLDFDHQDALKKAIKAYSNDQEQFQKAKAAIDEQFRVDQAVLDEKNKKEDAKKKREDAAKTLTDTLDDPSVSFKAKQEALDAEVKANEEAYQKKQITEAEYLQRKKENTEAGKELDKAELASKLHTADLIADGLGNLADLVGRQTVLGKAFQVAQTTINAISSATKSFDSLAGIPVVGPFLGAAAAASALAAGYANVKKIMAVEVPGYGAGVANAPVLAAAAPIAPSLPMQQSTVIDQSSIDDISQASRGRPLRAYVLAGDIQSDNERAVRLEAASRLGG